MGGHNKRGAGILPNEHGTVNCASEKRQTTHYLTIGTLSFGDRKNAFPHGKNFQIHYHSLKVYKRGSQ